MKTSEKGYLLRSWKEIATHFGVDERTCARWEKNLGMPVHRAAQKSAKSQVFAYTHELEYWFNTTFPSINKHPLGSTSNKSNRAINRPTKTRIIIAGAIITVIVLVFFAPTCLRPARRSGGQPADFHLRGSELSILDKSGNTLWKSELPYDGLWPEEKYRESFQAAKRDGDSNNLPWLMIKDINADGKNEVLFAVKRVSDSYNEGYLICFDWRGKKLWGFPAGRRMRYRRRSYSPDYRINGFVLHDINKDGRLEVIVSSFHSPWELCQLAVLDSNGKKIGEFWNAGFLTDIAFADIDLDGREEMYVAGVNNEYGGGCLAVFDPTCVEGASPQSEDYAFEDIKEGSELFYVDFPRTEVSIATAYPVAGNVRVAITSDNRIQVEDILGLFYEFDSKLYCLSIMPGHKYDNEYSRLLSKGRITANRDSGYYENLRAQLRYWNGTTFSGVHSMNLKSPALPPPREHCF